MKRINNYYVNNYGNVKRVFVRNLTSPRTGETVKNQFNIISNYDYTTIYHFQSYNTLCAKFDKGNDILIIYPSYNYSRTTSKYFKQWLLDDCLLNNETVEAVKKMAKSELFGEDCPLIIEL